MPMSRTMKKSTSMLEMNELHDVITFGEDMKALAQIDEERALVALSGDEHDGDNVGKVGAALSDDDDDVDYNNSESHLERKIRQDTLTLKRLDDDDYDEFFLADTDQVDDLRDDLTLSTSPDCIAFMKKVLKNNGDVKHEPKGSSTPVEEIKDPRELTLSTSPDCVAFLKKDLDDNVDAQDEPKNSSTLQRANSMACLQDPEKESKFRLASSALMPDFNGKESTKTNTTPPATSLSARQRLESKRLPNHRMSGSQGCLGASSHSLTSLFKSEGPRSSLKCLDGSVDLDSSDRLTRNVSFSSIEIRSYARTMGDAPTTNGIPVQLDWKYDPDAEEYSVDDYESYRVDVPRRDNVEMHMPPCHRQYLLMREWGFTRGEIKAQMEIVKKAAKDRHKTISTLKYQPYEERLEKTRRVFGKLTRSSSFSKLPNSFMRKTERK
ncbi:hypothetical protein THAOC_19676 [Thalassiosira oceanica]|uniref:Uncharacterized protein n=1 Tax=Thalassiosira oceanica TaxID=159749 RepID=K0S583_THAOC|nr:hypothetical protein THAOC_19676 [Thalassiosira oceanica]|eukprot:EJK60039.1 hypothetical protein THAOC_19676 [Thalassiosira oceanica]